MMKVKDPQDHPQHMNVVKHLLWARGGLFTAIVEQAPHGALFRSDLVWSGKGCDTYSYVISTSSRKLRCSPCRLRYGST